VSAAIAVAARPDPAAPIPPQEILLPSRVPQVCLKTPTEIPLENQWPWKTRGKTGKMAAQRAANPR
jgi:hypothetical protein